MLPIEKFTITKKKEKDGSILIHGGFRHDQVRVLSRADQTVKGMEEHIENRMRERLWREVYGDLLDPLDELVHLARYTAGTNPSVYPEAERIVELGDQLFGLLDWRKQLAAKQEEKTK